MATPSVPWSEQDLVTLLCTLNFRIEDIRAVTKRNPKEGLNYASEIIRDEIGNGCASSRVERKIKQLWASCGDQKGDKDPFEICLHGAFPKTLPGIEAQVFLKVSSRLGEMQRHADASKNTEQSLPLAPTRRSRRRETRMRKGDLVVCRCGFTHNILWMHCDGCATLQHAYCYYDTEDETMLPDRHLCDECKVNYEAVISQNVTNSRIQQSKVNEKMRRELQQHPAETADKTMLQQAGPFGLPVHERIRWGPGDDEIQTYLAVIRSNLHGASHSLEPQLNISKAAISDSMNAEPSIFSQMELGLDDERWLCPEIVGPVVYRPKRRQLLVAILVAATTAWVFRTPDTPTICEESILLVHYQEEVLEKHDMRMLESLHRRAYVRMMDDDSPLQDFLVRKAEILADRFLKAILPMMAFGQGNPGPSSEEWLASCPEASVTRDYVFEAFSSALKLMRWLPFTQKAFEFYTPGHGGNPAENLAVQLDDSSVEPHQAVSLCLMPGVVEYPSELFHSKTPTPSALWGANNIVRASEEQRKFGRVVSPALVAVVNKDGSIS